MVAFDRSLPTPEDKAQRLLKIKTQRSAGKVFLRSLLAVESGKGLNIPEEADSFKHLSVNK